jgi:aldehyde dehydrogenase (NAD+)
LRDRRRRAEKLIRHQQDRTPLLFIGGLGVESDGSATIQITNPANGEPLGRTPAANIRDVERAGEAAKHASLEWSEASPVERGRVLWQLADLIEHEAEDLAILEALQTGKTFREALNADVAGAVQVLRHYAGYANKAPGESYDLGGGALAYTRSEPHPVIGAILPWHAAFATAVRKIAPALASGSAVVVKPAEQAPLTIMRLAEISVEAGFPAGALNVVPGFGPQAGEALAMNKDVAFLSFSGSIETARRVLLAAAKSNLKDVAFELGGKSANIIFEDAQVRQAVAVVWKSIFSNAAASNLAGSRLLVHESLYETLSTTLTARAKEIVLGDPLDEHTELGPMVSEEHMKKVLAYVELGRREGARLVAGGKREVDGTRSDGWFVQPTVFIDVKPASRLAQEEIGGPVLSIMPFRSEDEAVEIANGTDYGLGAGVWTENLARAHRVAKKIKAGVVWVNHYGRVEPALPFGGVDLSGRGRDLGRAGLERYSRTKAIYLQSR